MADLLACARRVEDVPIPKEFRSLRAFPLDDALLLFDRRTGWNAILEGEETLGLRMRAPRSIQFAITNLCNLSCGFCSRDSNEQSEWTCDTAFDFLSDMSELGVLEVAFGGGETHPPRSGLKSAAGCSTTCWLKMTRRRR